MNKFLLVIIVIYLLLCPFYVFKSGLPQPADIIVFFGCLVFMFSGNIRKVSRLGVSKTLLRLLGLIVFIDLMYSLYYTTQGVDSKMFLFPLFYVFNVLFFLLTLFVFSSKESYKSNINKIALAIIISLVIQSVLGFFGITGRSREGARMTIFFNNPNQLGYYSLLMLSVFAILPSKYRANIIISLIVICVSSYLILLSGSRAALGGVVLLAILIFVQEGFKFGVKQVVLALFATLTIPFIMQSEFIKEKTEIIESRNKRYDGSGVSEFQIRGYDRFWIHPEYVLIGAGEGYYKRFDSWHSGEMHSGFGTILFSYGILGLTLFLIFIKKVCKRNLRMNLILLSPIFLYNLTHLGLRDSLFWMLFASVFIVSEMEYITKRKEIMKQRERMNPKLISV